MRLYRTLSGFAVESNGAFYEGSGLEWDALLLEDDLCEILEASLPRWDQTPDHKVLNNLRAPISNQEVWAAGVTYYRSRDARMEEAKSAGGGDFYDRVYAAERPELFFKATAARVVGPWGKVAIRDDAKWSVPEPELTLLISPSGRVTGYTIGNDMSSRDIEGENPLYLPQAKVYHRSCALGPCIYVTRLSLPKETTISLEIRRAGVLEFSDSTTLASLKRSTHTLVEYLYRNNSFPHGAFLLTGTGIVPPDSFTLQVGDEVKITILPIGTLVNQVG
jgi:2-dehydro-3-deoxy-D-arabinonate dehydratase